MPSLRAVVAFLLGVLLLVAPASATWSILILDLATGEVALGIATCLTFFDLKPETVVIVPGRGVAAAQSFVGPLSLRELIRTGLLNGTPVNQILAQLAAADPGHQSRQYGIASLTGGAITFTGTGAGAWAGGLTGQAGTLVYTIQGNVLTGQPVVTAAEQAILTTPGSIGDKLMAAMQAARSFGGDGRCSCSQTAPTACGAPPANFTKSAHIGLMILSRPSDLDAPCDGSSGCGAGQYWMDLNVANQPANAPDPVVQLQALYNTWKAQQVGRPDHFQSTVTMSGASLRANNSDTLTGTVVLRDAQGNPLGNSLPVTVALRAGSTAGGITFGPVTPQADGSYTFTMRGNLDAGEAVLDVAVTDAFGRVGIWPQPVVQVLDVFGPCGRGGIADGAGGVFDALRVQGTGGLDRVVSVGYAQPISLALDPPVGSVPTPPVGMFALWAWLGSPPTSGEIPLGGSFGTLCFTPAPFAATPTQVIADSFLLGGVYQPGAPCTIPIPGVPQILDASLQGLMFVDPALQLAATNAVFVRIQALPPPVITGVTPPAPVAGQTVTITGSGFLTGMTLSVAGTATPLTSQTPTTAQFVMPAGVGCDALLVLTNLGGSSAQRLFNATPVVTSQPYTSGPAAGGATLILVGQHLQGTTVTINGAPLLVTSQSATSIIGLTPPGTPGPATIVVQNGNGCQTTRSYTYY